MRQPLLPIVIAFAAGIWCAPHFFLSASQHVFWISFAILGALLLLKAGWRSYGLVVALLGIFLCGTFLAAEEHAYLPFAHIQSLASRHQFDPVAALAITGRISRPPVIRQGGEYFDVSVSQLQQPD